ncbi:MAG: S-layer homology domain-containing protein [Cyanobacteria bacterium J06598_1]
MTRTFLNKAAKKETATQATRATHRSQPFLAHALKFSLLASLLIVSGCEGSRIGSSLEDSLEPDPQLAENANETAAGTPADEGKGRQNNLPSNAQQKPSSGNASSGDNQKPDSAETASNDKPDGEETKAEEAPPAVIAGDYKDIDKAPEEIQPYLVDLIELDLLTVRPAATTALAPATTAPATTTEGNEKPAPAPKPPAAVPADEFRPNQAMTRREYARWMLAVNNKFYGGERTRKIRPGVSSSSQPVFQDVPASDPDFAAIQGLAEAGIIPSPLTGSTTTVTFRPNAPLTRKDLLLWKVPLDTRQALPEASVSAVQQAWGFQDAGKIDPRTLQAVLADYQNGDFANIRRAFNYTTLFQPDKAATRAEGAAVLWRFGNPAEGITAAEIRNPGSTSNENSEPPESEATDG